MNPTETEQPRSNKDKIIQAAIELFTQKGYAAVTMREIAAQVSIKAASIYNHYSGKEALLDEIVERFRAGLHSEIYPRFDSGSSLDIHRFIQNVVSSNQQFFASPQMARIGSIILREQFTNAKVRRMLLDELIIGPRNAFIRYFSQLMAEGKMVKADPEFAAREFHAFYIYRFYENSLSIDGPPPDMSRVQQHDDEHIRYFLKNFLP